MKTFYIGQIYEKTIFVKENFKKAQRRGIIRSLKTKKINDVLLIYFTVPLITVLGTSETHMPIKVYVINDYIVSLSENIKIAQKIEDIVPNLKPKRLSPKEVKNILCKCNIALLYGITINKPKTIYSIDKAIKLLDKIKKWKGWLGFGIYIRNRYYTIDIYSDGRISLPKVEDEILIELMKHIINCIRNIT